ncbi:MAG TPA: hypothetical protein VND62_05115 [Acidimicrobiales bacterium]|nr:hypothetical protein [Acidimicrobiales bacterium]
MNAAGAPPARSWSPVLAGGMLLLTVLVGLGAAIPLALATHSTWGSVAAGAVSVVAFASVGALIAVRRARNPIGWTLLGAAAFFVLQADASSYLVVDYHQHHGTLPLGPGAVLLQPAWAPAIILIAVSLLIFPDGRLLIGRTRWVVWGLVTVGAVWLIGAYGIAVTAILEHRIQVDSKGTLVQLNPPTGAWAWWSVAQDVFFLSLAAALVFWVAMQVTQYRKLTGDRRVQQKWMISGAVVCPISGMSLFTNSSGASHLSNAITDLSTAMLAALPISIGIAILKYRLYEIDRVISRTLSYLLLTGVIVGLYVGIISLATRAFSFSSPVAVAASTLAAAALFNPLRRRLQRLVDRRFNRARYDAEATVAAFRSRMREVVDSESVRGDLVGVVERTFEPMSVAICTVGPGPVKR